MLRKAVALLATIVVVLTLADTSAASTYAPAAGPLFNNPRGDFAAKNRILSSIIAAIDATPRYATIRIAAYSFDRRDVADALVAANNRDVDVQMVLNDNWTSAQENRLIRDFGTDPNRRSFVVVCHGSCRGGAGNQHMKFYAFSRTGGVNNVVMVGSANPTGYSAVDQWNDMFTVVDNSAMFELYSTVFQQLARDTPVPQPYVDTTIGDLKTHFYPDPGTTPATDPELRRLDAVHCLAGPGTGRDGHTVIRIVMYGWDSPRGLELAQKVADLARHGCDVEVILSSGGGRVYRVLKAGGVLVKSADLDPVPSTSNPNGEAYALFTHEKWMILSGGFQAGSGYDVWTGSANWSGMALHNDEVTLRIPGKTVYRAYAANFGYIWDHYSRWL